LAAVSVAATEERVGPELKLVAVVVEAEVQAAIPAPEAQAAGAEITLEVTELAAAPAVAVLPVAALEGQTEDVAAAAAELDYMDLVAMEPGELLSAGITEIEVMVEVMEKAGR
jgi:hypothetical protein